jgi:hypothetical protein
VIATDQEEHMPNERALLLGVYGMEAATRGSENVIAMLDPDEDERLAPGFADLATDQERGHAVHREIDRAVHLGHGIPAHGSVVFGEAYHHMGRFEFDRLLP